MAGACRETSGLRCARATVIAIRRGFPLGFLIHPPTELNADEILQRARALAGVRHISRVAAREVAAIEGLKNLLPALGLPGPLKLHAGNTPLDFIREGGVLLAVQTDGGYAPGVRETLMIIARELDRLG